MGESEHSSGHEPWQTQEGASSNADRNHEQVQMVSTRFLELELLAVHNDGRDLLVHEDQDGGDNGGNNGQEHSVPLVFAK